MEKLQGVGLKPWMDVFGMRIADGEEAPNRAAGKDEVKLRAPSSYPSSACCYWKQAQYHLNSSTSYFWLTRRDACSSSCRDSGQWIKSRCQVDFFPADLLIVKMH
ncbi:uncharacterized protein LOC125515652 isoform X2 [Triticum urartu]|uniref:uncharacterized protein LOC125515652 isoform X2 n=1 Tax=Triticum urartu TaxID=4572 RepID=UPI0020439F24|nr:uncharacterized protein LOC125515652 isoform X2 [Triticum urartu]